MTDSQQPQTTKSGSTGNKGHYPLLTPPPADHVSYNPGQVGLRFGWLEIISPERRYVKGWTCCMVPTRCTGCGQGMWTNYGNLRQGRSNGCQACTKPQQIPAWLDRRLTAMKQRCENPNDKGFKNYGARGIKFLFPSVTEGGLWVIENLGLNREQELDRIDNNGNYAPGNLRYATHREQQFNMQKTKSTLPDYLWAEKDSPLAFFTTRRYLIAGLSRAQIVERAKLSVFEKRKNWRGIRARLLDLGYMTS